MVTIRPSQLSSYVIFRCLQGSLPTHLSDKPRGVPEDIRRPPVVFGPFILDTLREKRVDLQRDVLARYKDLRDTLDESQDVDLMKLYEGVKR